MSKKHLDDKDYFYDDEFDWFSENDEFGDEFDNDFGEEEIENEQESTPVDEINRLNDIHNFWEIRDIDISHTFLLSELGVEKTLHKKNTSDLTTNLDEQIKLNLKHKLKLKKLKIPITEIYQNDSLQTLNLRPIEDMPIDLENLVDVSNKVWNILQEKDKNTKEIPQTQQTKQKTIIKRFQNKPNIFQILKQKNIPKYVWVLAMISIFILTYWFYTKHKLISTFENLKTLNDFNFKESSLDDLNAKVKDVKMDFLILNTLLKPVNWLNYFFENQKLTNLKNLVSWGLEITNFWINSLKIYDGFSSLIEKKWPDWIKYTQLFKNIDPLLLQTKSSLNNSINYFSQITDLENDDLNASFFSKLDKLKSLKEYFDYFYENKDVIESILWDQKERKYMVVFQNNDEIRPTWGFMWSVMFVTLYKWKILEMDKKDIYALEYLLKPYRLRIPAPEWINKLTQYFGLRDSNYYFDIWASSNKIKEFLDKTPYKIDGILYVNQNLVKDFLAKYWEVNFPFIKETITSENFSMLTSTLVEAKVTKTSDVMSTPKQVLFDFVDFYIKDLKSRWDYLWYIKLFFDSIDKRDVIFYSFVKKDDDFIKKVWLRNEVDYSKNIDFNYPFFTSISWNKSDRYIKREFVKYVNQNPDCSFDVKFELNQTHNFSYRDETQIKNFLYKMNILENIDLEKTLEIQWKQKNIQFVRVLLPKNAEIKSKKWLQIYNIPDFWEVWFYLETPLFSSSKYDFEYKIKNPECKPYDYLIVKQPWLYDYDLIINKENNQKFEFKNLTHNFSHNNF